MLSLPESSLCDLSLSLSLSAKPSQDGCADNMGVDLGAESRCDHTEVSCIPCKYRAHLLIDYSSVLAESIQEISIWVGSSVQNYCTILLFGKKRFLIWLPLSLNLLKYSPPIISWFLTTSPIVW